MRLREWINNHNAMVTMVTIVLLCIALALLAWFSLS